MLFWLYIALCRLISITLTPPVHPLLHWFPARTRCVLMRFKRLQVSALLRLISAATPFNMGMEVGRPVIMFMMLCILT